MERVRKMSVCAMFIFSGLFCTAQDGKTDTTKAAGKAKIKPYGEVITAKAVTENGLFKVHRIEDRWYFEIPDSLMGRDILTVNRISKAAADVRPSKGFFGYAGDEIGENVIQFSKGPNNKVFIQRISYSERSVDSSENGMYRSVANSNFQPIAASFDIKAISPNLAGVVIDITDYISADNDIFFFDAQIKKNFGLGAIQADKSYISKLSSYPENIEVKTVKTYMGTDNTTKTYELNSSIVLLPKIPMKSRAYDKRVGYFSSAYLDFDANEQGVEVGRVITKWRLEPKDGDMEKYKRGELVEPKKPIIFYIDPATPKKWVPYLMQGVNDWQKAFEQAGFKNAIYALEAPTNDPTWSLEDARHSAIIYKPSPVQNAYGPNVNDPRTGEILEAHVQWFHNVMELVHDWYMVQAGAIDPRARKMEFDDSLMGQLIRFVSSHEVGHTLGLMHNYGSSSTVPVDSLRSKLWVEANGHTPSIMDYARFNYVAQPEDHISEKGIFPRIGMYDKWAIEWGYKILPEFKTKDEEATYSNRWIIEHLNKDKRYWYGAQPRNLAQIIEDPRCQSEDLGDDPVKAGYYGIQNLKRIESQLINWTKEPNKDYASLKRMQQQVALQYFEYLMHARNYIGKYYSNEKMVEENGNVLAFVPKAKQKEVVQFLGKELFQTPEWLLNKDLFLLNAGYDPSAIFNIQFYVLNDIFNTGGTNLGDFERLYPKEAYTNDELLTDLEHEIWNELRSKKPIDIYRRRLQKGYAELLIGLVEINYPKDHPFAAQFTLIKRTSNFVPMVRRHMDSLINEITKALPVTKDVETRSHLMAVRSRLKDVLKSNSNSNSGEAKSQNTLNNILMDKTIPSISRYFELNPGQDCWSQRIPEWLKSSTDKEQFPNE